MKHPDTYTRNNVGHDPRHGHPYVTGYWYLMIRTPDALGDPVTNARLLNATAESFTPPSRNLSKEEIVGFGGVKKQLVVRQEESFSFSISFRERQNLPVFDLIHKWSNYAVHQTTGMINKEYKGQSVVILAKPTFTGETSLTSDDVEEIFFFDGISPDSIPFDGMDSDISTNDTKTINVTFNYDVTVLTKHFDLDAFLGDFQGLIGDVEWPEPYLGL